jgi:hypothetical protein
MFRSVYSGYFLKNINQLTFVMVKYRVLFEVRAELKYY